MNPYLFIAFFLMMIPGVGPILAAITLVIGLIHYIGKKIDERPLKDEK